MCTFQRNSDFKQVPVCRMELLDWEEGCVQNQNGRTLRIRNGTELDDLSSPKMRPFGAPKNKRISLTALQTAIKSPYCQICQENVGSIDNLIIHLEQSHRFCVKVPKDRVRITAFKRTVLNKDGNPIEPIEQPLTDVPNVSAPTADEQQEINSLKLENEPESDSKVTIGNLDHKTADKIATPDTASESSKKSYVRCPECFKDFEFRHRDKYLVHLKLHTSDAFYKCLSCAQTFRFKEGLCSHLHQPKGRKKPGGVLQTCSFCQLSFLTRNCLLFHLTTHDGLHRCLKCEMSFPVSTQLKKHCRDFHVENPIPVSPEPIPEVQIKQEIEEFSPETTKEPKFICPLCQAEFVTEIKRNSHVNNSHFQLSKAPRPFSCKFCKYAFTHKRYLIRHFRKAHNLDNGIISQQFSNVESVTAECDTKRINISQQFSSVERLKAECDTKRLNLPQLMVPESTVKVETTSDLDRELNVKQGFNCRICKRLFSSKGNRKRHERLTHSADNKCASKSEVICPTCGRHFSNAANCKRHEREIHWDNWQKQQNSKLAKSKVKRAGIMAIKARTCPRCRFKFANKNNMTRHLRMNSCRSGG